MKDKSQPQTTRGEKPTAEKPLYTAVVDKLFAENTSPSGSVDDSIIQKIKKCFDRANHTSCGVREQNAAMLLATRLMCAYSIREDEVRAYGDPDQQAQIGAESVVSLRRTDNDHSKKVMYHGYISFLLCAMELFFNCKSYTTAYGYCVKATFYGIGPNTAAAAMAFEMVFNLANKWAKAHRYGNKKNSYLLGIGQTLISMARLERTQEEMRAQKAEADALADQRQQEEAAEHARLQRLAGPQEPLEVDEDDAMANTPNGFDAQSNDAEETTGEWHSSDGTLDSNLTSSVGNGTKAAMTDDQSSPKPANFHSSVGGGNPPNPMTMDDEDSTSNSVSDLQGFDSCSDMAMTDSNDSSAGDATDGSSDSEDEAETDYTVARGSNLASAIDIDAEIEREMNAPGRTTDTAIALDNDVGRLIKTEPCDTAPPSSIQSKPPHANRPIKSEPHDSPVLDSIPSATDIKPEPISLDHPIKPETSEDPSLTIKAEETYASLRAETEALASEATWASSGALIRYRDTAASVAENYRKQKDLKLTKGRKRSNVVRDQDAYLQGQVDAKKIDVRGRKITVGEKQG